MAGNNAASTITVAGTITNIDTLAITDAGIVNFNAAVTVDTLTIPTLVNNVSMIGGGTIANAVTFANVGTLQIGDATGDTTTFTGGLAAVTQAGAVGINTIGTIATTNTTMTLGDANTGVRLLGDTVLNTGGGALYLDGVVSGVGDNDALTLNSVAGAIAVAGAITDISTLTVTSGTFNATSIEADGLITITNSGAGAITGIISNNEASKIASLTKAGTGTLTLSAANTFTGDLNINKGGVTVSGSGRLADTVNVIVENDNTAIYTVGATDTIGSLAVGAAGRVVLTAALTTGDAGDDTIAGVISGGSTLTKQGNGVLTLSASNTYTGATTVSAGKLTVSNNTALGTADAGTTVDAGATLELSNINYSTAEALALSGTLGATGTSTYAGVTNIAASSVITVATSATLNMSAGLTGAEALEKTGAGVLTLSAANTYSGDLTVSAGKVDNNSTLGDGADVIVADVSGAVYEVGATDTIPS
jgi:autotransporter-associated beta strand protein